MWANIRKRCTEETPLEGKEISNTVVITFAFQIVYTAFNALQNLHSSLHDEESLGNYCLAVLYGTAIISSILSPTIINILGAKTVLVCSFAAHCVYVLANFYPSFTTMAPAAVALGIFHGPSWTSQALYISASAFSFSKSSSSSPYAVLSRFNGIFFAVFATTQIMGNLVTSTVIRDGVGNKSDEVVIFKYCGPDDCPYNENATEIEDPEDWVIDITLGFFMGCCLLGLLLVFFLLSPLPRSNWKHNVSPRSTATSCFNVLLTTNMLLLIPFIVFTAVEHGFLMSAFTKAYIACPIGIHMVGYVMAAYGGTTPVFMLLFSMLAKIAGRFLLVMLSLCTHMALMIILFYWSPKAEDEWMIFMIPMIWGVAESILQAQANSLIAMLYPTQKEPAFANFHAWRSLGYSITFLNSTYLCVSTKLILCLMLVGIGMALYVFVEIKTKIQEKLELRPDPQDLVDNNSNPPDLLRHESMETSIMSESRSVTSLSSVQDRLSFDPVELADIIKEAEQGWKREDGGLKLELQKVMSLEHLRDSKVTTLYHTRPVVEDFPNFQGRPTRLAYSFSDGQLHDNAARVGRANFKMRKARSKDKLKNGKRRPVSEVLPPTFTFESIPEVVAEGMDEDEEEFAMQDEADYNYNTGATMYKKGEFSSGEIPFDHQSNSLNVEQSKLYLRRMSKEIDATSNTGRTDFEMRIPIPDVPDPSAYVTNENGILGKKRRKKAKFTVGPASPTPPTSPTSPISPASPNTPTTELAVLYRPNGRRLKRPVSYDPSYSQNEYYMDNSGIVLTRISKPRPFSDVGSQSLSELGDALKGGKSKKRITFKGFKKSKKVTLNPPDLVSGGRGLDEQDNSDADSDGFVNEDEEEVDGPFSFSAAGVKNMRKKNLIPISAGEDVTNIY